MASNPFASALAGSTIPDFGAINAGTGFGADKGPMAAPGSLPMAGGPAPATAISYMGDAGTPAAQQENAPIKKLVPNSDAHRKVLEKLEAMFRFGKGEMRKSYSRWQWNEQKVQAYTNRHDYETLTRNFNPGAGNRGYAMPEPVEIVVPYTYATLHAAATFISSVLLGRKPIFPLIATRGTAAERARYMEQAIQSNLDASRATETLWQGIWDSLNYGFLASRCAWETRTGPAISWVAGQRQMTTETTFAGNVVSTIDPYRFIPDPRVPMHECNLRGDFMFTEMDQSATVLKDMEKAGQLKWVKEALENAPQRPESTDGGDRRLRLGVGASYLATPANVVGFRSLREGTVRLVPREWGLGDSEESELWKFAWIEGKQIVQAEPLGMIHAQHPFVCSEPTSFGHDFMSLSMVDMIGPFQDILSWLVSSRMENVRVSINNQFVADPARVELNDIRSSTIGRVIRLKAAAMGLPIQEAIQQLVVQDVTQGHLADIQTMRILADTITGVNDNLRGIQNQGGRRSATEARMSMQAGGSRLSQLAVRVSSQAFLPLANQMIMNIQQFMPDKMWIETSGDDGQMSSLQMTPEMLIGSFNYQVSDGTLPFDKSALVEVWKEIMMGVAQDPELRQAYSLPKIFEYTAELGGAKNIDSFKNQPQQMPYTAGAQADPSQDPNLMPVGPAMPATPMLAQQAFLGGQ